MTFYEFPPQKLKRVRSGKSSGNSVENFFFIFNSAKLLQQNTISCQNSIVERHNLANNKRELNLHSIVVIFLILLHLQLVLKINRDKLSFIVMPNDTNIFSDVTFTTTQYNNYVSCTLLTPLLLIENSVGMKYVCNGRKR